jgi:hypothetical protein
MIPRMARAPLILHTFVYIYAIRLIHFRDSLLDIRLCRQPFANRGVFSVAVPSSACFGNVYPSQSNPTEISKMALRPLSRLRDLSYNLHRY